MFAFLFIYKIFFFFYGIFPADTFPLADLPGLTSEESLAQFLAEKVSTSMCTQSLIYLQNLLVGSLDYFIIHSIGYILMERLYHSKRKYCYLLETAMYHTHQQNMQYMDVHQIQTSWTEVTAQQQEVDELIWRLDCLQQKIDSRYYAYYIFSNISSLKTC